MAITIEHSAYVVDTKHFVHSCEVALELTVADKQTIFMLGRL
jgi:hypothetical protein